MTQRRVWQSRKAGRISRLQLQTEAMGELGSTQVRVRTRAVGLNFADIFALAGLYSATPDGPFVPGLEVSGEVEAVGSEVDGLVPGQRVMGATRFGGYADRLDMDPTSLALLPDAWSFSQGAASPVQSLTAYYALKELGNIGERPLTLVHCAAGGVGLRALAICRRLGAPVIGSVSTTEKRNFLQERGFDEVIVRQRHFNQQLSEQLQGRDLRLVLDSIGGEVQRQSYEAMAPMGRLVVFGAATFTPGRDRPRYLKTAWQYLRRPRYDALGMISDNKSVMGFNLIWLGKEQGLFGRMLRELEALELDPPHVGHEFDFSEAPRAVEKLRSGRSIGKVVLILE